MPLSRSSPSLTAWNVPAPFRFALLRIIPLRCPDPKQMEGTIVEKSASNGFLFDNRTLLGIATGTLLGFGG